MNDLYRLVFVVGALTVGANGLAHAEQLKTMDDVGSALRACWSPPPEARNSSVTLSFSFKRDGSLIGTPRPTAINVPGDEKAKKAFTDAAVAAIKKCVPLELAPSLAQGIGGGVYTMEFTSSDQ